MKNSISFQIVFLFCALLSSCAKDQTIVPSDTSHTGIYGTWEWRDSLLINGDDYLRITFYEHSYRVESHYMYCSQDTCVPHRCFFYNKDRGNYKIVDDRFYIWHVTPLPNFAEIPFQEDIAPMFGVTLQEDTMVLTYLHALPHIPGQAPSLYKLVRL